MKNDIKLNTILTFEKKPKIIIVSPDLPQKTNALHLNPLSFVDFITPTSEMD
jgi:hypothetical protein